MQTNQKIMLFFIILFAGFAVSAYAVVANQPNYGTGITVDGDSSDWDLTADFFANMYEAGNPTMDHFSTAYLRYDCTTNTLYALVLRENGWLPDNVAGNAWIKVYDIHGSPRVDGNSGNDGIPPDFAWVYDGGTLIGYESSFSLAEGLYNEIEIHVNVNGGRTSSTGKKQQGYTSLLIDCPPEVPGEIIIIKQTIPDGDAQTFSFTPSWGTPFNLSDGGSNNSGPLAPGTYSISESPLPGWTLVSAVCSDGSSPSAIGLESGETVTVTFTNTKHVDYGDAPDSYGTLGDPNPANHGASHDIIPLLHLGPSVDTEPDGQPSVPADGDGTDENGVTLPATFVAGTTATIIILTGPTPGLVDAWIDFNGNGIFDHATEHLWGGTSQFLQPGVPVPFTISVPASAVPGTTYARFRFSLNGGLLPTGHAPDGEVEDYVVQIEPQPGFIIVEKQTDPDGATESFEFSTSYAPNFFLADNQTNNSGPLAPGVYSVSEINIPTGWTLTSATCDDGSDPSAIGLDAGETVTCTFVNTKTPPKASISDFVWVDTNGNGIQDGGESGFQGATVELYDCQDIFITNTTTNLNGNYGFYNITPGDYYVKFILPTGYVFSPQDQGVNDGIDSDADITTGKTVCTNLTAGENDVTWDAGLIIQQVPNIIIRARKYHDINQNGAKDSGEPYLSGWKMKLTDANQTLVQEGFTDANGWFVFDPVFPGEYTVCEELKPGWVNTQAGTNIFPSQPCFTRTYEATNPDWTILFGNYPVITTLEVEKDANVYLERTFEWDIHKTVEPDEWHLFHGESGESQYTVSVTKSVGTDMVTVSGQITVTNTGGAPTQGLIYIDSLQYKTTGDWEKIEIDGGTPAVIEPGKTGTYTYEFTFEAIPGAQYRNVAVARITNYDGHQGQLYGPRFVKEFIIPTVPNKENYAMVNVEDTNGMQWQFTDSGSKIYTKTFVCDEHEGSNGNTATIMETGKNSSATVMVYCYELDIQKDAETSFMRQYHWMIDKTAEYAKMDLDPCVKDKVPYVVTVDTTGYTDKDFMVTGTISIHNPAPMAATINSLKDILDGELAVLDCQPQFPLIINPGKTFVCGYHKSLPTGEPLLNKAKAVQQLYDYPFDQRPVPAGTVTHTGTKDVVFTDPSEEVDECVTVTDTNLDPGLLGNACADETPKVFNYSLTVGPYFTSGSYIIDNTATYKTNDTGTEGSDDWRLVLKVKCIPPVADFKADIVDGASPLTVKFTDLSTGAVGWLWDFGDGTTSTEQHPTHIFRNPPLKYYTVKLTVWDCCEEFEDTMVKEDYIRVTRAAEVKFNAAPLVVAPDEEVQFMNHCGGGVNWFEWNFGDGQMLKLRHNVMDKVHPTHAYAAEGTYTVSLNAWGQGGNETFTVKDMIYVAPNFVNMQFMEGSPTLPDEPWENAMNHDIITSNANAVALNNDAWAVFSLVDDTSPILFDKVRILSNNGMGTRYSNHLIKEFELWVSIDNVTYEKVMTGMLTRGDMWKVFEFTPKAGKYVKLMVKSAQGAGSPYATLGEIQLFGTPPAALALLKDVNGLDVLDWEPVTEFSLENAYPNPFNPSTTLQFALPVDAMVQLEVYNIRGQLVETILNRDVPAGRYTYHFDAGGLNSGIYFYRFKAGKFQQIKRMTFLK